VIVAALRDLQWRSKRFAIAIAATSLVFGVSLVMSGLSASFTNEADNLLDVLHGTTYLAAEGEAGPFTTSTVVPTDAAPEASPLLLWNAAIDIDDETLQVGLVGLPAGWQVPLASGRATDAAGEVVADRSLGLEVGEGFPLGAETFEVVGTMDGVTLFGGQPMVVMVLEDVQDRLAGGASITRAFIEGDDPGPVPAGLDRFTEADAREDLLRPTASAGQSIFFVNVLLWIVAACIVGSVIYLSALERSRDFAVFKATGVRPWQMGAGLVLQSVIVALGASVIAVGIGFAIAPSFPMPVSIPIDAVITLPALAILIGVAASLVGMRRTVSVDPALAFGGR
jgi:putative ABC transport system permease protein